MDQISKNTRLQGMSQMDITDTHLYICKITFRQW